MAASVLALMQACVWIGYISTAPSSATSWPGGRGRLHWRPSKQQRRGREGRVIEAEWSADRAKLRLALRDHPAWSVPQLAHQLGRSASWVKQWRQRLRAAAPDDEAVLHSRSRARKQPPPAVSPLAVERILAMRDAPPANLQRVPGPDAILYFLQQDPELQAAGVAPPRSSATVWQVLRRHGRIPQRRRPAHVAPRHCLVTRNSPISFQMQGCTKSPSYSGRTPSMYCEMANLQQDSPDATPPAGEPRLSRRSFAAGALVAGLGIRNPARAADANTIKIGTFGPFTGFKLTVPESSAESPSAGTVTRAFAP